MGAQRRKKAGAAGIGTLVLAVALYVLLGPAGGPEAGVAPSHEREARAAVSVTDSALRAALRSAIYWPRCISSSDAASATSFGALPPYGMRSTSAVLPQSTPG